MPNTTTCLVTGCAGFVGSHLCDALLKLGHKVLGVDNFFSGFEHNMEGFRDHEGFCFYEQDVVQDDLLPRLHGEHPGLSHIFHLAAVVSVPYSIKHPELTRRVNFESTRTMHGQAKQLGVKGFVFAGSAAEYGEDNRQPLKEEYASDQTEHQSPYGIAKYKSSKLLEASGFGVSLRCFNIFGPRQDPSSPYSGVISRFIEFGTKGQPLTVFGDGSQTRDFIFVADVIRTYLAAAGLSPQLPQPPQGIYNVGTGKARSVLDLAQTVNTLTGSTKSVEFGPERTGDIRHSVADISRLKTATGFSPDTGFEDGLRQTMAWSQRAS